MEHTPSINGASLMTNPWDNSRKLVKNLSSTRLMVCYFKLMLSHSACTYHLFYDFSSSPPPLSSLFHTCSTLLNNLVCFPLLIDLNKSFILTLCVPFLFCACLSLRWNHGKRCTQWLHAHTLLRNHCLTMFEKPYFQKKNNVSNVTI